MVRLGELGRRGREVDFAIAGVRNTSRLVQQREVIKDLLETVEGLVHVIRWEDVLAGLEKCRDLLLGEVLGW